ncbi:hypothetical protein H5410_032579 [Solanum commersonii]|uniref:Uncharacterized protein n=1 Tax=Solanum commersonii TaxID=4109 RepID=A0A9J5YLF7_SOLCO|nr:hypothetical protein H5410_032579 [Solanum commersonii]
MIDTLDVLKRESLKYLDFIIQENEEINEDAIHRIEAGLTILFEIECWSIKNPHFKKMKLVKMRMHTYMMSV